MKKRGCPCYNKSIKVGDYVKTKKSFVLPPKFLNIRNDDRFKRLHFYGIVIKIEDREGRNPLAIVLKMNDIKKIHELDMSWLLKSNKKEITIESL